MAKSVERADCSVVPSLQKGVRHAGHPSFTPWKRDGNIANSHRASETGAVVTEGVALLKALGTTPAWKPTWRTRHLVNCACATTRASRQQCLPACWALVWVSGAACRRIWTPWTSRREHPITQRWREGYCGSSKPGPELTHCQCASQRQVNLKHTWRPLWMQKKETDTRGQRTGGEKLLLREGK